MNEETIKVFEQTTQEFLNLLDRLDENTLNQKGLDDHWSPGQIGQHILKSYASAETLLGRTKSTVRKEDEKDCKNHGTFLGLLYTHEVI